MIESTISQTYEPNQTSYQFTSPPQKSNAFTSGTRFYTQAPKNHANIDYMQASENYMSDSMAKPDRNMLNSVQKNPNDQFSTQNSDAHKNLADFYQGGLKNIKLSKSTLSVEEFWKGFAFFNCGILGSNDKDPEDYLISEVLTMSAKGNSPSAKGNSPLKLTKPKIIGISMIENTKNLSSDYVDYKTEQKSGVESSEDRAYRRASKQFVGELNDFLLGNEIDSNKAELNSVNTLDSISTNNFMCNVVGKKRYSLQNPDGKKLEITDGIEGLASFTVNKMMSDVIHDDYDLVDQFTDPCRFADTLVFEGQYTADSGKQAKHNDLNSEFIHEYPQKIDECDEQYEESPVNVQNRFKMNNGDRAYYDDRVYLHYNKGNRQNLNLTSKKVNLNRSEKKANTLDNGTSDMKFNKELKNIARKSITKMLDHAVFKESFKEESNRVQRNVGDLFQNKAAQKKYFQEDNSPRLKVVARKSITNLTDKILCSDSLTQKSLNRRNDPYTTLVPYYNKEQSEHDTKDMFEKEMQKIRETDQNVPQTSQFVKMKVDQNYHMGSNRVEPSEISNQDLESYNNLSTIDGQDSKLLVFDKRVEEMKNSKKDGMRSSSEKNLSMPVQANWTKGSHFGSKNVLDGSGSELEKLSRRDQREMLRAENDEIMVESKKNIKRISQNLVDAKQFKQETVDFSKGTNFECVKK